MYYLPHHIGTMLLDEIRGLKKVFLFSSFYRDYRNTMQCTICLITLVPCSLMKYVVCLSKNCTVPFGGNFSHGFSYKWKGLSL